jgi:transcriptional regulator with XRE-family HTH domain
MPRTLDQTQLLEQFGLHLQEMREKQRLSQEDLSIKAGLGRSYYNEVECGKRNISLLNLQKLAVALNVSLSELLNF